MYKESFFACLWVVSPTIMIWKIWWTRNKIIFRQKNYKLEGTIYNTEKAIFEAMCAYTSKYKQFKSCFTSWDDSVLKEWKGITLPFKGSLLSNDIPKVNKKDIKWEILDYGFGKLNFDGAL